MEGCGNKKLIYHISATRHEYKIVTDYGFLDAAGNAIYLNHLDKLVLELMALHPVIRIRDSRRLDLTPHDKEKLIPNSRVEKRIENTSRRLLANPGQVNKGERKEEEEGEKEYNDDDNNENKYNNNNHTSTTITTITTTTKNNNNVEPFKAFAL